MRSTVSPANYTRYYTKDADTTKKNSSHLSNLVGHIKPTV